MPRKRTVPRDDVLQRATGLFWRRGYEATSVQDLVDATGANRAGLYGDFTDKRGLFLSALDRYADSFVGWAFGRVEAEGATVDAIRDYFETLIDLNVRRGLPSEGCLMANSMTEVAPRDEEVRARVRAHVDRQRRGFRQALVNSRAAGRLAPYVDVDAAAHLLAVATQGFAAYSRICTDATELRGFVDSLLAPLSAPPRREETR
ncbi:MAG: TetR/AcrR family transcriptional regulator [Chloroflexi bacterium]|nr:MAG: TetR/AcrR family transcriptional regulator [Chloroflexota bacterium]